MPIIDNELVAEVYGVDYPALPNQHAVGRNYRELLRKNLAERGDTVWMTDITTGKSMTYSQLGENVDRVAAALVRKGLKPGDTVIIMAANHIELAVFFFGTWAAGGVSGCLTLSLLPAEIRRRLNDLGAKFVFTDPDRASRVLQATAEAESVQEIFVVDHFDGCTPFDQLIQEPAQEPINVPDPDPNSLCWMLYSSGTTGVSKGIVHTHQTLNRVINHPFTQQYAGKKLLFINYMINAGGMVWALSATGGHAQIYVMSAFSDDMLLEAIDKVKPQMASIFPSQIAHICRHPELEKFDLNSLVVMSTTGSGIHPVYERQIFDKVPNLLILNISYGMTELYFATKNTPSPAEMATLTKERAIARHIIGSVGKLLPFTKLKIVDVETGEKLGPGHIGEICLQTPFMLKEYFKQPEETAKAIINGWYHTGDKCYYDNDENLFVIGRYKELIKYRMAHVLPTNIEKHLMTHPAVEDAGVVGLPHDVDGELPVAFIVGRQGYSTTARDLIRFIDERVVDEERLRGGVFFTEKIPRNDLGKIVRHQLMNLIPNEP